MSKERTKTFVEISREIDLAWGAIIRGGQFPRYQSLDETDIERIKGGKLKKGEEKIAAYLSAIERYFTAKR